MMSFHRRRGTKNRPGERGQSLVEFTVVLSLVIVPVFLSIVDFARAYGAWVTLQNASRVAANYAAGNPLAWGGPSTTGQAKYASLISTEMQGSPCTIAAVPDPQFPDRQMTTGAGGVTVPVDRAGDRVIVNLSCGLAPLTPWVSAVVGSPITLSATAVFPVHGGIVVISGPGTATDPPEASFTASPDNVISGRTEVVFSDTSIGYPSEWDWQFGNGQSSDEAAPPPQVYDCPTADPSTGTEIVVTLTVRNAVGEDSASRTIVCRPPGPLQADFSGTPTTGAPAPLDVSFVDMSTGSPTGWDWSFGDGAGSAQQNPSHTYTVPGTYTVTLTVSAPGEPDSTMTKTDYIIVGCQVPNFVANNTKKNSVAGIWAAAGFTGQSTITYNNGNGNYRVGYQSPQGGLVPPTGCSNTKLTVGP